MGDSDSCLNSRGQYRTVFKKSIASLSLLSLARECVNSRVTLIRDDDVLINSCIGTSICFPGYHTQPILVGSFVMSKVDMPRVCYGPAGIKSTIIVLSKPSSKSSTFNTPSPMNNHDNSTG